MLDHTADLLNKPFSPQSESFGLVASEVVWHGDCPSLFVTVDSESHVKPLANDNDMQRLEDDLALSTHCSYSYPFGTIVLFNGTSVLGMYRQLYDNPTYSACLRAVGRLDKWRNIHTQYSNSASAKTSVLIGGNEVDFTVNHSGVQTAMFTISQRAESLAYDAIVCDGKAYKQLDLAAQAACRAIANHLSQSFQWHANEALVINKPSDLAWLTKLAQPTLDRLISDKGIVRRTQLVMGEFPMSARALVYRLVEELDLLEWHALKDIEVRGMEHYQAVDHDPEKLNFQIDAVGTWTGIIISIKA